MGTEQSKQHKQQQHGHAVDQTDPRLVNAFNSISNGTASVGFEQLKASIGSELAASLWPSLHDQQQQRITLEQFVERADTLLNLTPDLAVRMLMPAKRLVISCLEADGLSIKTEDDRIFVDSLVEHMEAKGKTADSLIDWKNTNCARMCQSVVERAHSPFSPFQFKVCPKIHSGILNGVQMFILRHGLPTTVYFPSPSRTELHATEQEDWTLLYSSTKDGMSTNTFESKAFGYRGPSVLIVSRPSGEVYAVATDEEWRHCSKLFGGPYSVMYKFCPKFDRIQCPAPAISCNFKSRSSPLGISYGNHLLIDEAMSNVHALEVWGCAGIETLQEQAKQKHRHALQAERNAKVPMPGKWDEDKAILEMAGHRFSNERRD